MVAETRGKEHVGSLGIKKKLILDWVTLDLSGFLWFFFFLFGQEIRYFVFCSEVWTYFMKAAFEINFEGWVGYLK